MTFKYNNVYINETATVVGKYEKKGPFRKYYDKSYDDFYMGEKTWEQAEIKMIKESVSFLLNKIGKKTTDIDLFLSGDLLNQLAPSNYAAKSFKIPYLGIYNACATSVASLIIASNMIEAGQIRNAICNSSSHNNGAEKQYRYPVEYGAVKPKTTTFTVTGSATSYLSKEVKGIKVESATIGRVIDLGIKDVFDMGAVMTPSCADTIYNHLRDLNRNINYYDLVLSGDLGIYGKEYLKDYMKQEYNIDLVKYDDTATMIYDTKKQPVYAGGSGVGCAPLVLYSYIFKQMKEKKLKRVLLVATGSLHSTAVVNEHMSIPSIAHAISLEAI